LRSKIPLPLVHTIEQWRLGFTSNEGVSVFHSKVFKLSRFQSLKKVNWPEPPKSMRYLPPKVTEAWKALGAGTLPCCLSVVNLRPSNWSSRLTCYDKINVTYVKRLPPHRKSASWWENSEKPSTEIVFSRMRVSILLFRQLIRCTSLKKPPALSVPPSTNMESLILAARCPVLPGSNTGVAWIALRLDEKFISILNITIHQINNQYIFWAEIGTFTCSFYESTSKNLISIIRFAYSQ